ncbi:ROK family protein [Agreia sp. COWG]|uniref:ROK family protein n=1 Tax=Agreia sp. COWG TaxID=2773266 RepID=UPI001928E454|nr:ROK family protein [Agreia sp. COWG]CAD5990409.1 Predicted N-acetyl-glucosamine kinase 2, ROK family [Agreia sp. COWG]
MIHPLHSALEVVIAIDIGGTTVKGAAVDFAGTLVARQTTSTFDAGRDAYASVVAVTRRLVDEAAAAGFRATGIGIATPGLVDSDSGTVRFAANLGWESFPLRELLEAELPVTVRIGHDARMAAIAELAAQDAGEGYDTDYDNALIIPIGTGVSAAVVTGGVLVAGATAAAGELGHMQVIPNGALCSCGQHGCIEAYASGTTILDRYRQQGGTLASSTEAIAASIDTDPVAARVWGDAVTALAIGLSGLTAVLDPAVIVIGGGVSAAGDTLIAPLREAVAARLGWRSTPRIERSALGAQGGLIGAAIIGWADRVPDAGFARQASLSLASSGAAPSTGAAPVTAGIVTGGTAGPKGAPHA